MTRFLIRKPIVIFIVTSLVVLAIDQLSKAAAVRYLKPRIESGEGPIFLWNPWLRLTYTENSGAAFGLGTGYTWVFTGVAIVVGLVVIRFSRTITSIPWALAFAGLLGGLLGNLTDRIFRPPGPGIGWVVDFIGLPNFPVFNVADMSITFAAVGMTLLAWRGVAISHSTIPTELGIEHHELETSAEGEIAIRGVDDEVERNTPRGRAKAARDPAKEPDRGS